MASVMSTFCVTGWFWKLPLPAPRPPTGPAASPALPATGVEDCGACAIALPQTSSAAAIKTPAYFFMASSKEIRPQKLGRNLGLFQTGRILGQRRGARGIAVL